MEIAVLIVNSIAAFAAVLAAIIAVDVYKKSAKQQEQAINYSLLESRIKIWKYFEHDRNQVESLIERVSEGREWKVEQFRLLFSDKLVKEYDAIVAERNSIGELGNQIDTIERDSFPLKIGINGNVDTDAWTAYTSIKNNRKTVTQRSPSLEEWLDFKRLCEQAFAEKDSRIYYDKVKYLSKRVDALNKRNKEFICKMEEEIESSVN